MIGKPDITLNSSISFSDAVEVFQTDDAIYM